MQSITVLGAGTAGLVSALIIKRTYPNVNVVVIESDSIGIVGVGEGSTEHWKHFIDYCGINLNELIRETDATLKIGIKFENWNGDNNSYFHSIVTPFFKDFGSIEQTRTFTKTLISNSLPVEDTYIDTNLIPYDVGLNRTNQYHFNTFKLNSFLHKVCEKNKINFINMTVKDVVLNTVGSVDHLVFDSGDTHYSDFFIDSSGFKRVISSKLGAQWVSYKKYLPMNHALAFPTDDISDLKTYTLSRALSSGWNWRIPTQNRYGNGYVFCDDFINSEKAISEIENVYKEPINVAKDIKFEAGRIDKFWIKNCVSIGLSASFVEPLEASSIGNSILQAFGLVQNLELWELDNSVSEIYNKHFTDCFDNIVDFVQLHYFTNRNDSEFWKNISSLITVTDFNKQYIELFKKALPTQSCFMKPYLMFNSQNYTQVMYGLGLLDKEFIKNKLQQHHGDIDLHYLREYNNYLTLSNQQSYIEHSVLLKQNNFVME